MDFLNFTTGLDGGVTISKFRHLTIKLDYKITSFGLILGDVVHCCHRIQLKVNGGAGVIRECEDLGGDWLKDTQSWGYEDLQAFGYILFPHHFNANITQLAMLVSLTFVVIVSSLKEFSKNV